ncbi:recombinase family protein [Microbacterium sp. RURRCA19A]|uniref:recombinase family protein n=1 Tax=Microbacterium sp. RURRCA19A TaxID=1907391 RepID=UPI0009F82EF8|nr:recombinase family protein [Microbacterium sp. RURRCA19A]
MSSDLEPRTAPGRRRASFAGWEHLLGLDGSAPPTASQTSDGQAVVYLRVSTPRQMLTAIDIDADGNSIATQREACTVRARRAKTPIAAEFVEPGNSAQSIAKRPVFREMLRYIEEHPEVTYVVIYMRSRAFRNLADAAITKRILASMGVKLISAKEDFGEGYMADAMEAVTDIMNEVQVRQSGEDIKQKMRHKAVNGGT